MSFDALTFGRLRCFTSRERSLLILSIIGSLIYFVTQRWHLFPASVILKALGMAPLALIAFRLWSAEGKTDPARRDLIILGLALSFSCLGDIFLDLGSSRFFIHGLSSFLVAHLIYIVLFYRSWKRPLRPSFSQLILLILILIYSLLMANWLSPSLGAFANPVMIYVCVITAMVLSSILAGFSKPWIWIGAVLFLISDSIIAAGKFKGGVPFRDILVWSTYYIGQYGIAIGYLHEKLGEKKSL